MVENAKADADDGEDRTNNDLTVSKTWSSALILGFHEKDDSLPWGHDTQNKRNLVEMFESTNPQDDLSIDVREVISGVKKATEDFIGRYRGLFVEQKWHHIPVLPVPASLLALHALRFDNGRLVHADGSRLTRSDTVHANEGEDWT